MKSRILPALLTMECFSLVNRRAGPKINNAPYNRLRSGQIKLRGIIFFNFLKQRIKLYGTTTHILKTHFIKPDPQDVVFVKPLKKLIRTNKKLEITRNSIINPNSDFKNKWNTVVFLLLAYVFVITPWVIAFEELTLDNPLFYTEYFVDFLFLIDIILTLNTAYYDGDKLVCSRLSILRNYLKGFLVVDLIGILPFHLFLSNTSTARSSSLIRIIRIAKVSKIMKASKLTKIFKVIFLSDSYQKLIKSHKGFTRLFIVIFILMILAHFTSCMWYFTAKIDDFSADTWIIRGNFQDSSKGTIYLAGLYWAFTVLTTVGFGDIHAATPGEMLLCIFWMLFAVGFYSFIAGTITSILSNFDTQYLILHERFTDIDSFGQAFSLPNDMVKRMKTHVIKINEEDVIDDQKRMNIISLIPRDFRYSICLTMFNNAAEKLNFFTGKGKSFIIDILPRLNCVKLSSGQVLFYKNETADDIYFLVSGRVTYTMTSEYIPFREIVQGSYFGEVDLVQESRREFSAIVSQDAEILTMDKRVFWGMIEHYPALAVDILDLAEKRKEDILRSQDTALQWVAKQNIHARALNEYLYERNRKLNAKQRSLRMKHRDCGCSNEISELKQLIGNLSKEISKMTEHLGNSR